MPEFYEDIPRLAFRAEDYLVWWSHDNSCFMTNFAPPADFDGYERGKFGEFDYQRSCSEHEAAIERMRNDVDVDEARQYSEEARREWYGMADDAEEAMLGEEDRQTSQLYHLNKTPASPYIGPQVEDREWQRRRPNPQR